MAQKKSFKADINPALQFISKPEPEAEREPVLADPPPPGYKLNPLYVETKSKRLQLLVQPSLLEKIRARAKAEGESVNNLVHRLLEEAVKGD